MAARRIACLLAVLLLAATAAGGEPARRVVSLNPSLTSILVALGARDALVGVDRFSARQQPAVASLPQVGGLSDPSLEAVIALRPDLVVLVPSAEQRDFRGRLQDLGVPLLAVNPVSFEDVLETIAVLGARVGRSEAARARVAAIRAARSDVEAQARERAGPTAVLVLQRDPLFVIGRGSFIDEMLTATGARNLAAGFGDPYPRVSREWLIAAAPELILDASQQPDDDDPLGYWSRWPSLPAVKSGRVRALPEGVVTLPGPYLDEGLRVLAAAVSMSAGP